MLPIIDGEITKLAEQQATVCSVFANPKRILILWALVQQERTVTAIAQAIGASLQSTSQHLSLMKAAGILVARRDGQTILYRIATDGLANHCHLLIEASMAGNSKTPDCG